MGLLPLQGFLKVEHFLENVIACASTAGTGAKAGVLAA
jgi:hypothetical protein